MCLMVFVVYRNCENRKHEDYELILYEEINKKESQSKYKNEEDKLLLVMEKSLKGK